MLETAVQLESSPPVRVASASTKSVDASERVKVSVDDSPALKELSASSLVIAILGRTVSGVGEGEGDGVGVVVLTEKVTVLLASVSSWLLLPAASENLLLAT